MSFVKFDIKGINKAVRSLNDKKDVAKKQIAMEVADTANRIANGAIRDAPNNMGLLRSEIMSLKVNDLTYDVVSMAEYSPYVEWGTRSKVDVPIEEYMSEGAKEEEGAELRLYAMQFKGKGGKSGDAKEAIYHWCKRRGIPEEFWSLIFFRLMTEGSEPHPFFFKQIKPNKKQLLANLKNLFKVLNK